MVSDIKYKHQDFQADAVDAVCSIFEGQHYSTATESRHIKDSGIDKIPQSKIIDVDEYAFHNASLDSSLTDEVILKRIVALQKQNLIRPSTKLEGHYNLTIQMETGTGKTYVYIKTIFELNMRYGWTKFIVIVPSVAIREGIKSSFESTQKHFAQDYGKKIRFFIYNSSRLSDIDSFANDNNIQVMIINNQAFNATGKDARRIEMELDEFRSRKPIDVIASTNPILIIDEPQTVEGKGDTKTKEQIKKFKPFFTLRYSATHRKESIYNMIYRLDSMDAYNKKLVKRIAVKGMSQVGTTGTDGYVYIEDIQVYKDKSPMAHIGFERKIASGVDRIVKLLAEKDNLYSESKELQEYKDRYYITTIDADRNIVSFANGLIMSPGDVVGSVNSDVLRRLQIRETIKSHIEREQELYFKGIKVLSLFFIDEVAKYRQYDESGNETNGLYGEMFEQEYASLIDEMKSYFNPKYCAYLESMQTSAIHKGYFSVDKKGRSVDSTINKKEGVSDDVTAYDLIMKNKTLLLDLKNEVRFIFSHSALREGWDNPNVFQICTLKEGSDSDIRKLQEVGRGLRLCINQNGERMDESVLGEDVQRINELTVIASESYKEFTEGIQKQIAEGIDDRPLKVNSDLFVKREYVISGETHVIDKEMAEEIVMDLIINGYIDKKDRLPTDKYHQAKESGTFELSESFKECRQTIIDIVDTVFDPKAYKTRDARDDNVTAKINMNNLGRSEFVDLWKRISRKTAYTVNFDSKELVDNCISILDSNLKVTSIMVILEEGKMNKIDKQELVDRKGFSLYSKNVKTIDTVTNSSIKYDLIGKIVDGTNLTRATVAEILKGIKEETFNKFKSNPEEFISKVIKLINQEKATMVIQSIEYSPLDDSYGTEIFTSVTLKGKLGVNMMPSERNVFDYIQYDSPTVERPFAEELEKSGDVIVYAKIPVRDRGFKICTPVGNYTPDWAIAFKQGNVKHVYFVAETKGSLNSLELRGVENAKIACAKKHFEAICGEDVKYDVVTSFEDLLKILMN